MIPGALVSPTKVAVYILLCLYDLFSCDLDPDPITLIYTLDIDILCIKNEVYSSTLALCRTQELEDWPGSVYWPYGIKGSFHYV